MPTIKNGPHGPMRGHVARQALAARQARPYARFLTPTAPRRPSVPSTPMPHVSLWAKPPAPIPLERLLPASRVQRPVVAVPVPAPVTHVAAPEVEARRPRPTLLGG